MVRPSSAFGVRARSAQGCHLVDASLRGFLTSHECGDGFVSTRCHLATVSCDRGSGHTDTTFAGCQTPVVYCTRTSCPGISRASSCALLRS